jgi:alpha-tubulin suppressor-like RCC1 family protein
MSLAIGTLSLAISLTTGTDIASAGVQDPVVTAVSASYRHTCAIADGSVYCWGDNNDGQIGIGEEYTSDYIDDLIDARETEIEEELLSEPDKYGGQDPGDVAVAEIAAIYAPKIIADGAKVLVPFKVLDNSHSETNFVNSGITGLALGDYHTCAIKGGSLYCWGSNSSGQLGLGQTFSSDYVEEIVNGDNDLTEQQIAEYAAKGYDITSDSAPRPMKLPNVSGGFQNTNVTAVAAGVDTTCAVAGGSVYCWGSNGDGKLGDPSISGDDAAFAPNKVPPTENTGDIDLMPDFVNNGASAVSVGSYHVCAIVSGSAFCWGSPGSSSIGDGRFRGGSTTSPHFVGFNINTDDETPLTQIQQYFDNDNIVAIEVGWQHSCLLKEDTPGNGEVYCWGAHQSLGLTDPDAAPSRSTFFDGISMPTKVDNAGAFTNGGVDALSSGHGHSCVVTGGVTYCWGTNSDGQIGDGTDTFRPTATQVGAVLSSSVGTNAAPGYANTNNSGVSVGDGYSCVIANGYLYCWGDNSDGQLGEGGIGDDGGDPVADPSSRRSPTLVFRYSVTDAGDDDDGGGDDGGGGGDGGGWNGSYQIPSGVLLPDTR